ncbi:isocitrate lyase/PEP mutase family protein [Tritonibacter mobilis]|uniref:isocitrate lyase/PEP mutase family protein n=1 Tax=Tritonibacter mobilis TaxID=379347 RepID=UPI0008069250|nr:isocitrate lyase/phosphoenolpyruvate mutase family protein [Tritonibacter mobilis]
MSQVEKAIRFAELHRKGDPLVLYNIWDAAGAKALVEEGVPAIATGSWAMAAAHGYEDGESIPLDFVLRIVERICATVSVPVSVDFEGGYATTPAALAENTRKIIRAGAVGINFEDRVINGAGLHAIATQAERIRTIRAVADEEGVPLFINARTDLFLGTAPATHPGKIPDALQRQAAYAEAGANCFFVPGLTAPDLIAQIIESATDPVNLMMIGDLRTIDAATALGASRLSYGAGPFLQARADLKQAHANLRS